MFYFIVEILNNVGYLVTYNQIFQIIGFGCSGELIPANWMTIRWKFKFELGYYRLNSGINVFKLYLVFNNVNEVVHYCTTANGAKIGSLSLICSCIPQTAPTLLPNCAFRLFVIKFKRLKAILLLFIVMAF